MHKETVGELFKARRKELGIGSAEFAKQIDVSANYYCRVENDYFSHIPHTLILKIINNLDFDTASTDKILGLAGYITNDVLNIILKNPVEISAYLRSKFKG